MSKKLVIVESPSKAKTIEKYLGSEYKVIASKGHILDLPKKSLGIDEETFKCDIGVIPGKEQTVKEIQKLAKDASEIYLASDPDREGEAIAFHLQQIIKRKDCKRALFHSITKPAIIEAIKNAKELDKDTYDAQQTRRILDRLIGYKCSPVLWKKLQGGLSAGRVQSVALKIIVLREREIEDFVPEKWFEIHVGLNKDKIAFNSKFVNESVTENITKPEKLTELKRVDEILSAIKGKEFKVAKQFGSEKTINPQPPYTTSKLQQEASSKLKMKSKETMQVAQKLYENGYITYMRTDSVRTEPDALKALREQVVKNYGEKYLSKEPIIHKQKKSDSKVQDAHEAIRPTSMTNCPVFLKGKLTNDELRLYTLIWNKFMASQMAAGINEVTTVVFNVAEKFWFKSVGSIVVFDGFRKVFGDSGHSEEKATGKARSSATEDSNEEDSALPKMAVGGVLFPTKEPYSASKESNPPARYNESGLVKDLEEKGIGRPSTYATIISNISDKGYVSLGKDERFIPSEIGFKLCDFLEKHFPVQMNVKFTSETEEKLDDIEEGKTPYKNVLKVFLKGLNEEIEGTNKLPDVASVFTGKTFEKKYSKEVCPKCSKRMCVIKGKNGEFLSCEDYPACKSSMPMPSKNKVDCPSCKKNRLSIRKTKSGDDFVGCSGYPDCKFVVWSSSENFESIMKELVAKVPSKKK